MASKGLQMDLVYAIDETDLFAWDWLSIVLLVRGLIGNSLIACKGFENVLVGHVGQFTLIKTQGSWMALNHVVACSAVCLWHGMANLTNSHGVASCTLGDIPMLKGWPPCSVEGMFLWGIMPSLNTRALIYADTAKIVAVAGIRESQF